MNELLDVIKEYVEFCNGVEEREAIPYIYENILYDYKLPKSQKLVDIIKSIYNKGRIVK